VDISTALAADLSILTGALDKPGADLSGTLRQLAAAAKRAVHSYLGLSITLSSGGRPIIFTALDGNVGADIRASLRMWLPPDAPASRNPAACLVLYAAAPGAFTDLAADLRWLTGTGTNLDAGAFALDADLIVSPDPDTPSGLTALSTINQVIGVLIGRGDTPEQAHRHLDRLAAAGGVDRAVAAGLILADVMPT
jgi:hypothetical protein